MLTCYDGDCEFMLYAKGMDLLLVGPRSLSDDGDVVLYKQSLFSAVK